MESFHVHASIRYRFVNTRFTTVIRNKASHPQNVDFAVAIPKSAFLTDFNMESGGKPYFGEVKERTVISHNAATGGRADQLKTSRDSNKFGASLMVAPDDTVTFTLTYSDLLRRKLGNYELQIYLNPGQVVKDLLVEVFILENTKLTKINVPALRQPSFVPSGVKEEENSLARIDRPAANAAHILFAPPTEHQGARGLAHTFVVQYDVEHSPGGDIVVVDGYFFHFFAPDTSPLPKDIVFVLDVSGSMSGDKMQQMKDAMYEILGDLLPQDRFDIVPFSSWAFNLWGSLASVNSNNIYMAKQYVSNLIAYGGTNIYEGITKGRQILYRSNEKERVRMIFFLTDGQDRTNIQTDPSIAIYGLAFGDDADLDYIKSLCSSNGGFSKKIYVDLNAASQVEDFYNEVSRVSMKDVQFSYQPESVDEASLTQTNFPVLFEGSEVIIIGKVKGNANHFGSQINLAGRQPVKSEVKDIKDLVPKETSPFSNITNSNFADTDFMPVEKTWAYATIQQLLAEDEKKATVKGDTQALEKILDLSVKYKFVAPLTSMVVNDPAKGSQLFESAVQNAEEKKDSRNMAFLQSRPPTTTVTTTTTTKKPWCPPIKSVDESLKSNFMMQTNVSNLVELCIGTKKNSFRYLRKAMNVVLRRSINILKYITPKDYNSSNETTSHRIYLSSLTITDGNRSECLDPRATLDKDATYTLVQSSEGASLYLVTGWSKQWGKTTPERLLFNSSKGQVATVFLGTSEVWRITGDAEFKFKVTNSSYMNIGVENIHVTLERIVSRLAITYFITVNLGKKDQATYKGILADRLNPPSNTLQDTVRESSYKVECPLLGNVNKQYKMPPHAFLSFYLNVILDLNRNLPVHLYD